VSCWIFEKVNMSLFLVLFPVKVANVPIYPEWCYSLFYYHQCYLLL